MPLSIGVNLRVTGYCNQGGRKYMEDMFSVAFQQTSDDKDLEYAFFGIFDGHGGGEAATFAKEHLMNIIVKQKNFWSDKDEDVLRAIRDGYVNTHYAMWRELDKWPRTASGLPSTAGTTASIAFIRKGKIYIGHVGDSGIILGFQDEEDVQWKAKALTKDHKPESGPEMVRIEKSGGKVVSKSGVPRVVWNRPRIGHKGPVRRSTHIDEIPFLAVARSLGDLWSYNSELDTFVVSPEPDVKVVAVEVKSHRCLIFGTDGLWNMLTPQGAVSIVQTAERHNEKHLIASQQTGSGTDLQWINPSKSLVDRALERWSSTGLRADNTSVITLMLDPPGRSRSEVLLSQKKEQATLPKKIIPPMDDPVCHNVPMDDSQRPVPTTSIPYLPKPPALETPEVCDEKQPDSSECVDKGSVPVPPETESLSHQESVSLTPPPRNENHESNDMIQMKGGGKSSSGESIQVAEISSSDTSDENVTVGGTDPQLVAAEKSLEEKVENSELPSAMDVNSVHPPVSEPEKPDSLPGKNTREEDSHSSTMPQSASVGTRDELKEPVAVPLEARLRSSGPVKSDSPFPRRNSDLRTGILSGPRCKHSLPVQAENHRPFTGTDDRLTTRKRRYAVTSRSSTGTLLGATTSGDDGDARPYVILRSTRHKYSTKALMENNKLGESPRNASENELLNEAQDGTKQRHKSMSQTAEEGYPMEPYMIKRRTRSEDRPTPMDENGDPANRASNDPHCRLRWPSSDSSTSSSTSTVTTTLPPLSSLTLSRTQGIVSGPSSLETQRLSSPNPFQRRSLEKKATPVKTIRRLSMNGQNRTHLRGSFGLRDWDQGKPNRGDQARNRRSEPTLPQRWLRSDTIAATPVKALRSRNVEIPGHAMSPTLALQFGVNKQNRLSLPAKLKQQNGPSLSNKIRASLSTSKLKPTGGSGTTSGNGSGTGCAISKRVKSPYNPSTRSLSTRSRIKRLGK
ncbi:uncharacterized protein LOC105704189 isoform X2 [Orussus abietinus]|uniref:uncharacterized protein LOC105704189 isoform X2 n=1 Tax=Orussus abietinus TaxID=222816 RepID=UPI0006257A8F|nr:uncharacterized protein LOC105704189 isoform X2 [Orussus abietinus]